MLPCETMAIFLPDMDSDEIVMRYAAGAHAASLRGLTRSTGAGIAGWVAVNLKPAVNADPSLDLGYRAAEISPALRSCLAVPLVDAEISWRSWRCTGRSAAAFSEDELRLVELLAPRLATSLAMAVLAEESLAQPATTLSSHALRLVKPKTSVLK